MSWAIAIEVFKYGIWAYFSFLAFRIGRSKGHMEGAVDGYRKGLEHNEVIFRIQAGIIERLRSALREDTPQS
jgi:hypothetical protein